MAFVSRISNWFERMLSSTPDDDDEAFDGNEADGFLMRTGGADAPAARPAADETGAESPPTLGLPFAPPAAAGEDAPPPAPPVAAVEPPALEELERRAAALAAGEDDRVLQHDAGEPAGDSQDVDPPEIGEDEAEEGDPSPGARLEAQPAGTAAVEVTAAPEAEVKVAQAGSTDDLLSMFRNESAGSEFRDFTKDMEDVPAQELLEEARAVRDLLGAPEGTAESAA
jgi:hypothetical protein